MSEIGVNKVILIGYVGQDPELRQTSGGKSVTNFSLAVGERWKDGAGEKQEKTEWFRCVCWNGLSDVAVEYLSKGRYVYVEGRLQSRTWEDDKGEKRASVEVVVSALRILDPMDKGRAALREGGPENSQRRTGRESQGRRRSGFGEQFTGERTTDAPF